jgi:phage protein D
MRVKMDQVERDESYPGMSEAAIAAIVMARYAQFGIIPKIIPPLTTEVPLPMDRVVTQAGTDLAFLNELAARVDYIFTIIPGELPMMNIGYFGPQPRLGLPQPALTVNMGAETNVTSINFQFNAADAQTVSGEVQDRQTNAAVPVRSMASARVPLAIEPAILNRETVAERRYRPGGARTAAAAMAEAQAMSDQSTDVLTVEGELDGGRYGRVLETSGLIGLRGAGLAYDGLYVVREVKHRLSRGSYKQTFKLVREGTGSTVPVVRP